MKRWLTCWPLIGLIEFLVEEVVISRGFSWSSYAAGNCYRTVIWTVGQTIDFLRSGKIQTDEFYLIFVVDPARKQIGEVALSKLLCAQRPRRVVEIMDSDFRSVPVDMDQEEVALLFRRYGMVSAGVIDADNRLVGMITIDDVIDVIDEEAEEDLMALAWVGDANEVRLFGNPAKSVCWLLINLGTAILASVVIGMDATIEQLVALAILMPIVASMGAMQRPRQ